MDIDLPYEPEPAVHLIVQTFGPKQWDLAWSEGAFGRIPSQFKP